MEEINTTEDTSTPEASGLEVGNAAQTQVAEPSAANIVDAAVKASTDGKTPEAEQYQPNFKFKVHDKEFEIDEWMRGVITNKEMEQKARELYEKAYGLDVIKPKLQKTREEKEALQSEYGTVQEGLNELRRHVKNRDFDEFFKSVNIPKEWVYEWAVKQAKYQTLPQDEKQRYDQEVELRRRNAELEKGTETYETKYRELAAQQKRMEVDSVLSRPQITEVVREFDSRAGREGAFREYLAIQAVTLEQVTGRPVSAEEAVNFALMVRSPGGQPAGAPAVGNANPNNVAKPIIPNIKSRGGSPVRKAPTSIDDLRARAREMGV